MSSPLTFQQAANVIYKECKRNHAVTLSCTAVDGCQEFTPAGLDGTTEALICDACACHRSFHCKVVLGNGAVPISPNSANATAPFHIINDARNNNFSGAEVDGEIVPTASRKTRNRTRTIFTPEQKAEMESFARRLEWKTKNGSEGEVDSFCNNMGISRKVFRGWMNNNRHLYTDGTA